MLPFKHPSPLKPRTGQHPALPCVELSFSLLTSWSHNCSLWLLQCWDLPPDSHCPLGGTAHRWRVWNVLCYLKYTLTSSCKVLPTVSPAQHLWSFLPPHVLWCDGAISMSFASTSEIHLGSLLFSISMSIKAPVFPPTPCNGLAHPSQPYPMFCAFWFTFTKLPGFQE